MADLSGVNFDREVLLVYASPHKWGDGKNHGATGDWGTFCGIPPDQIRSAGHSQGMVDRINCKRCLAAIDSERGRRAFWADARKADEERAAENAKWWAWYNEYLKTPEWKARRRAVLVRCRGVCEGCGDSPATHVHHLSYDHAGEEFLFELVGVCLTCHQRLHPDKEIGTA